MTVPVSMRGFVQTGRLGPLHLGLDRRSVESLLGPPDDVSIRGLPLILKYRTVQLTFADDALTNLAVSADRLDDQWHGAFEVLDDAKWGAAMEEVMKELAAEGLPVHQVAALTFADQSVIRVQPSGADLLFVDNALEKVYVHKPSTERGQKRGR